MSQALDPLAGAALTSTVMVPWSGPMVCSVSLSSSFLYSHSTPMAMKDLELGSKWFSSFKMNLPVSRFLTAENGRGARSHYSTWLLVLMIGREAVGVFLAVFPSHYAPGVCLCHQ